MNLYIFPFPFPLLTLYRLTSRTLTAHNVSRRYHFVLQIAGLISSPVSPGLSAPSSFRLALSASALVALWNRCKDNKLSNNTLASQCVTSQSQTKCCFQLSDIQCPRLGIFPRNKKSIKNQHYIKDKYYNYNNSSDMRSTNVLCTVLNTLHQ